MIISLFDFFEEALIYVKNGGINEASYRPVGFFSE